MADKTTILRRTCNPSTCSYCTLETHIFGQCSYSIYLENSLSESRLQVTLNSPCFFNLASVQVAQSQPKYTSNILDFQKYREEVESKKKRDIYAEIASLADHIL